MKILALTKYDSNGASSRLRTIQYTDFLKLENIDINLMPLITNKMLNQRYENGRYRLLDLLKSYAIRIKLLVFSNNYELILIEKELMPWAPYFIEKLLLINKIYIMDFDDATFHNYDLHESFFIRCLYRKKLDKLMNNSRAVHCGNDYLISRAKSANSKSVRFLPTVVNLDQYKNLSFLNNKHNTTKLKIVWIGTPETQKYLSIVRPLLNDLSESYDFKLILVGVNKFEDTKFEIEFFEWSKDTENKILSECDIGIMPLYDSAWERGKCGYKLIQYMASGLAVIGSNIGVNNEIIDHGINGYLADDLDDWRRFFISLMNNSAGRKEMGKKGRTKVEQNYNIDKWSSSLSRMLKDV
jgi:glycosyltransferase involved in cell wall biosynthesis